MDTLIFQCRRFEIPCKLCEYIVISLLLLTLIFSQAIFQPPIFANDLLANSAVTTPLLKQTAEIIQSQIGTDLFKYKFEERIKNKYQGISVTNVADGIKHIKLVKYYNGRPVKINIVEMNSKVASDYELMPATASTRTLQYKTTLRTIANRTNSVVALNGGFFKPQTGVPLGTLMIDGKMYTGPIYNRVALGIFDNGYDVARVEFNGRISGNGYDIKIDNINQPRMLSSYVLAYSRDWGKYAPPSPRYGAQIQVVGDKIVAASANPLPIPEDGYVIVGPKDVLSRLYGADKIDLKMGTNPKWENVKHIISGGPYLVKNGDVYVDAAEEKLLAIGGRNPRSAIGYTRDNDLILVAVDGREGSSIGLTLTELAHFMKSLNCVNAINLDGGGSTVMYVNGNIVNNPHQVGGIALSNAVVISKKY